MKFIEPTVALALNVTAKVVAVLSKFAIEPIVGTPALQFDPKFQSDVPPPQFVWAWAEVFIARTNTKHHVSKRIANPTVW